MGSGIASEEKPLKKKKGQWKRRVDIEKSPICEALMCR